MFISTAKPFPSMAFRRDVRAYLAIEIQHQQRQIQRRQGRPLPSLDGTTVILVDDGIATGSTYVASVHALKELKVPRIIGAIPVGP